MRRLPRIVLSLVLATVVSAAGVVSASAESGDPDGPTSGPVPIVCDIVDCDDALPPCNAHLGAVYIVKELGSWPPFISTDWWRIPSFGATALGDCSEPIPEIGPKITIAPDGGSPVVWANECTFASHCEAQNDLEVRTKHRDGLDNCFIVSAQANFAGGQPDVFPWDNERLECRR